TGKQWLVHRYRLKFRRRLQNLLRHQIKFRYYNLPGWYFLLLHKPDWWRRAYFLRWQAQSILYSLAFFLPVRHVWLQRSESVTLPAEPLCWTSHFLPALCKLSLRYLQKPAQG